MEASEQKIKNAVCRIQMKDSKCCKYEGTGFLFGNGWVITAAHNFQDDTEPNKGIHNFLKDASFNVSFHVRHPEGLNGTMKKFEFQMQKRTAFAHHLQPGRNTDLTNKDIAMVKLGVQYECDRREKDYKEWEKKEKEMLTELNKFVEPLSHAVNSQPITQGGSVYAVYYQACSDEKELKEIKVLDLSEADQNSASLIRLEKKRGVLRAGTSGCPILARVQEVGEYFLAGLHFSGDDDNMDGKAYALPWNEGIKQFVDKGTPIGAENGAYFAYQKLGQFGEAVVKKSFQKLEKLAKDNNLTIYAFDGTVINPLRVIDEQRFCCIVCCWQ